MFFRFRVCHITAPCKDFSCSWSLTVSEGLFTSGFFDSFYDSEIASATAQISDQRLPNFIFSRMGIAFQQGCGTDQHARSAKTTLHATRLNNGILQFDSLPPLANPSTVTMFAPSHSAARTMQLLTGSSFIKTVQAPHSPAEQPFLVPVRESFSLNICNKVMLCGTSTVSTTSLTVSVILE
jgi:hypothetical protein